MIDKFFNTEADRDLWLKLDAERQINWEKNLTYFDKESGTYKPTQQALHHRSMDEALEISRRALDYDIKHGVQRFTLEDFLILSQEELNDKRNNQLKTECFKQVLNIFII